MLKAEVKDFLGGREGERGSKGLWKQLKEVERVSTEEKETWGLPYFIYLFLVVFVSDSYSCQACWCYTFNPSPQEETEARRFMLSLRLA